MYSSKNKSKAKLIYDSTYMLGKDQIVFGIEVAGCGFKKINL